MRKLLLLSAVWLLVQLRLLRNFGCPKVGILLLLGLHLAIRLWILLLLARVHVLLLLLLVTGLLVLLLLLLREASPALHWHLLFRVTASATHG